MSRHLLPIALAAISPALGARADSSTNLSITVQVQTDADGRFQFDNVSPQGAWGFSLPERGNVGSRTVTAGGPVVLNIHLRFTSQNGKPMLELTGTSEK